MALNPQQTNLVHDIFVRTADENYVTARWCALNGLEIDFFWLAVHALEKYSKAVLLLNGYDAIGPKRRGYEHDIVKLCHKVKTFADELLPDRLLRPDNLVTVYWPDLSTDEFIKRLYSNGKAQNRYLIYGYTMFSSDLYMLDQMVFALRRLIWPLDYPIVGGPGARTITHRQWLTDRPNCYNSLRMPLDDLIGRDGESSPKRAAALNCNVPFAPPDFVHTPARAGIFARNPVIVRSILDPLNSKDQGWASEAIDLAQWLLDHIKVPRDVESDIKKSVKAAKGRPSAQKR